MLHGGRMVWQMRKFSSWQTPLPQTTVISLAPVEDGVWVSSHSELWRCADTLECVPVSPLNQGQFTGLVTTADGVWCGTTRGLRLWDGSWHNTPISEAITSLAVDDQGCLWSLGAELRRYCAGSWASIPLPMAHPLAMIAKDRVWVGGRAGIAWWDEESRQWRWLSSGGACLQDVRALASAPDGSLWIGTGGHGACRYNGTWKRYATVSGAIPYNVIRAITPTGQGAWLATESPADTSGAVAHFDGQRWTEWTPHNSGLVSGQVFAILDDGQKVWFATLMGLSVWQKPR